MKLKNLTDLADLLRGLGIHNPRRKLGFDMEYSYQNREAAEIFGCGSACCIGGWVQYKNRNTRKLELEDAVKTICPPNTSMSEIYKLCYPSEYSDAWRATPQQAARAVEILRDTGKCDWDEAMK